MGTLGFLLPFRKHRTFALLAAYEIFSIPSLTDIDDFAKAIDSAFEGKAMVLHRMRLSCTFQDKDGETIGKKSEGRSMYDNSSPLIHCNEARLNGSRPVDWQVMNEVALHRGSSPHLNTIDVFVDGQHLTEAVVCDSLLFIHEKSLHTDYHTVRRANCCNSDGLNGILTLSWRAYCSPRTQCYCPNTYLPSKSILQTSGVPIIVFNYIEGKSGLYTVIVIAFSHRPVNLLDW